MAQPLKDITGNRYSKLLVIGYAGPPGLWLARCDCGNEKILKSGAFRSSKSCGCARWDFLRERNIKHGDSFRGKVAPEYRSWHGAVKRCTDPNHKNWPEYGGRGITICERWRGSHANFLQDMGRKPSPKHTIERINNDGGYEPGNCHWALRKEQSRNRRGRRMVSFQGRSMPVSEAAELAAIEYDVVLQRLDRGWSEERALLTPALKPFGGTGNERFSHSPEAISLIKVASAIKAYSGLSEGERALFERVIEP